MPNTKKAFGWQITFTDGTRIEPQRTIAENAATAILQAEVYTWGEKREIESVIVYRAEWADEEEKRS